MWLRMFESSGGVDMESNIEACDVYIHTCVCTVIFKTKAAE